MTYVSARRTETMTIMTVDRPPANAMNLDLLTELGDELAAVAADPPRALILAGREGFFSGGVDLKAVPSYGPDERRRMVQGINRMVIETYALRCPVLAAVTGHAIAGGLVLALCADYRIASTTGRYGLTEIKVGVPYPQAAMIAVRCELAPHAARRLAFGNRLIEAEPCVELGVFDEALAANAVLDRAIEVAAELGAMPADVYAMTKTGLRGDTVVRMKAGAASDPLLEGPVN
jgi:enoyl-CoA hydratase